MRDHSYGQEREGIDELLQRYERLLAGQDGSFLEEDAFLVLVDYFDEQELTSHAVEVVELGLNYFPYSSQLMIKKADLLIIEQRYSESLALLDAAFLLDATDINIYILKTDAYLALDEPAKAAQLLETALGSFEGEERLELLFELSDVYDDYEDFEKVFDCLQLILKQDPNNEEALYKICFWTDFTGRNEESIRIHQEIIDEYPYNELAWFNLAAAFQGLKLYEKSIDAYQYAIAINDKFDYAYRNMGDALMRLRKYKEAIECLSQVLKLIRPEEVIYEAIGHCYHRLHNFAQARFHYRKASHLHPGDSKLHYKIALTYMDQNQWQSALQPLEMAMSIHHSPEFHLALGECKLQMGDFKSAIQYFGLVVRQRPRNIPGWEALIRCLYLSGYYEEAVLQSQSALVATDNRPIFYFYNMMALMSVGKVQEALSYLHEGMKRAPKMFKKALELNPSVLQNSKVVDVLLQYKRVRRV